MRAIRGAITVKENSKTAISEAAEELINKILTDNNIRKEELVSIIFTATLDLDQAYPAAAVRKMGYDMIPLLCYQEMFVKNSLEKCIRAMVYINRECSQEEISHIYLRGAKKLRPDLV